MFCPNCGEKNTQGTVFCSTCGKSFKRTNTMMKIIIAILSVIILSGMIGMGLYLTHSMSQKILQTTSENTLLKAAVPTLTPTIVPTLAPTNTPAPVPATPTLTTHAEPAVPGSDSSQYNQGYNTGWSEADADIITFISLNCSPVATIHLYGYGQKWGQIICSVSGSSNTLYYDENHYTQYGEYWNRARLGYKERMDKLWNYMWANCRDTVARVNYSTDTNGTHVTCRPY